MKRISITPKLTLVFVLFAGVLLIGLIVPAYFNARAALRAATVSERLSTALEKQTALAAWVADREHVIEDIANISHIREHILTLVDAAPDSPAARAIHDALVINLRELAGDGHQFAVLQVIEAQTGRIIASTQASDEGKFREEQLYFVKGRQTAYVQNPYYDIALQRVNMTAAAPVFSRPESSTTGGQEPAVAVVAGTLELNEMNDIIQRRTGLHQTDDAFLVNTANLLVTQPHLIDDPAVLQRGIHTAAVNTCLTRTSGVLDTIDYRSIPAIIVYRWLPERELCLIAKIDQSEAYAPSQALGATMAITGAIVLLIGSIGAFGISQSITRPIRRLAYGTAQIGQGNLIYRIEIKSADEIGQLGHEFNQMAAAIAEKETQLRQWAAELERRVEDRTAALSESEERYRILAETSPDMIFVINREDQVAYVNTRCARQFGQTPEAAIGQPLTALFPPEIVQGQAAGLKQVLTTGEPVSAESPIGLPGGQLWLDTQLVPIKDQAGQVNAVMGVSRDVTERKRAEDELARRAADLARSNAELEQFAYVASHDLQEPLRMVSSYMQLLARRYQGRLDSDADDFIGYAVTGARRMQQLINDLLAYSRLGTRGAPLTGTDCEAVFEQVVTNLKLAIEDCAAVVTHDPLPVVDGDESQLTQLLQNLIGNALKFRGKAAPIVHVSARPQDQGWLFSVRDNGIGIEQQFHDRIFIIFQRLHARDAYPGTGIGLAICKKIVERHGGRIWIESTPGEGSTFYFTLAAQAG